MSAWMTVCRAILRRRRVQAAALGIVMALAALAVTAAWGLAHATSVTNLPAQATEDAALFIPFLAVFGILSAVVAVLIVANLIGGIVIAGLHRIGILKSIGFTPGQITAIHLGVVQMPALVGALPGTAVGYGAARVLAAEALRGIDISPDIPWWIPTSVVLGAVTVVALAALGPTLRARRMAAATALTAGTAPQSGRGLRVQRWLAGRGMPRSVTLGAGIPFTRLGRSALTAASVIVGVAVITLSFGVTASVVAFRDLASPHLDGRVIVSLGDPEQTGPGSSWNAPPLTDASLADDLAALPGVNDVVAALHTDVTVSGSDKTSLVRFYRMDQDMLPTVTSGRQATKPGEATGAAKFMARNGLHLGDSVTVGYHGRQQTVTIVGVMMGMTAGEMALPWSTLRELDPGAQPSEYQVQLDGDEDRAGFDLALAETHPELYTLSPRENSSDQAAAIVGGIIVLTVILALVSAIGVFNTVLLTVRERRRDLGTLKSIGMTPRQVVSLFVTSTLLPGVVGGALGALLGLTAHRILIPLVTRSGAASFSSDILLAAFTWPSALPLALAGIVIAALGAVIPARRAARIPIAAVLRDE